jgi:hypothetical protein
MLCAVLCFSGLAAQAEDTDALIAKGDQFDKQLQAKEALEVYLPANKLEPDNVKLLVCIARQYRHLMSDTSSKQEKLRLGNVSLEFASRAATLAPQNAEAQLSPACQSEMKRVEERIEQVKEECGADAKKFCQGIRPGQGRILACLKSHQAELAPACAAEFNKAGKK